MRILGKVTRADGSIDDVTCAVQPAPGSVDDEVGFLLVDFRTTDGEELVLEPQASVSVDVNEVLRVMGK